MEYGNRLKRLLPSASFGHDEVKDGRRKKTYDDVICIKKISGLGKGKRIYKKKRK